MYIFKQILLIIFLGEPKYIFNVKVFYSTIFIYKQYCGFMKQSEELIANQYQKL